MTQEVTMMRDAAIRNMAAMTATERLDRLAKLLAVAQAERRKAERQELFMLHGELLRIHNELVCSEQHKIAQAKQREEERKKWQLDSDLRWSESTQTQRPYTPPPAEPKPQYQYDPTFHREQQRGMLAFGMVVGGVMAVVVALHIAPMVTASLIGGVILLRYLMAEKPTRDAQMPGSSQHIHYHYHNTQNIHEK